MKKLLIIFSFCFILLSVQATAQTTFILVRHAEKAQDGTKNPPLNEKGLQRADQLAAMLSNQKIAALYSTPYQRTQQTLAPIAAAKTIEVAAYDPFPADEWISEILSKHDENTIVIAGHSNTIPALANKLLGDKVLEQFDEKEYGNLLVIVADELGKGTLIRLTY